MIEGLVCALIYFLVVFFTKRNFYYKVQSDAFNGRVFQFNNQKYRLVKVEDKSEGK